MHRVVSSTLIVAGLVLTLGGASSWGQVPSTNDTSDSFGNTGGGTSALGSPALSSNYDTAYGFDALVKNSMGDNNTALGALALFKNTTGSNNTASGFDALGDNNGDNNTAYGYAALSSNTTGHDNTASGFQALWSNTTGFRNTASGQQALYSNTDGYRNTASGANTLKNNTTGTNNTASGVSALENNNGHFNTASGVLALFGNISGKYNTAGGYTALYANTTGHYNTALGYQALFQSTGSRNLALGNQAGYHLTSGSSNIYLGHTGAASESTTMRLGQVQSRTFVAGTFGVPVNGGLVAVNSKGQLGVAAVSSARYKRDIQAMRDRSQGLFRLRPVTFRYKQDPQGQRQYGLIAEEVVKVYPELVTKGADGKVESVQYHELIPLLLNEVQHQQQELTELKAQNERLQAALLQQQEREAERQAQNAALAARLERLEQGGTREAALVGR
jgi:trimeric autotransporter adhesin